MKRGNFFYEAQGIDKYLVYRLDDNDDVYIEGKEILTNRINGIAETWFTQRDNERVFKYKVSGKTALSEVFKKPVSKIRLISVFLGIINGIKTAYEEYALDLETFVLDEDLVFVDERTNKTELICLPLYDDNRDAVDFRAFFKQAMEGRFFEEDENGRLDYPTKIQNYLNSPNAFTLDEFAKILMSMKETVDPAPQPPVPKPPVPKPPVPKPPAPRPPVPKPPIIEPQPPFSGGKMSSVSQMFGPEVVVTGSKTSDEPEEISLFYALWHFSGENWEKYKEYKNWLKEHSGGKEKKKKKDPSKSKKKNSGASRDHDRPSEYKRSFYNDRDTSGESGGSDSRRNGGRSAENNKPKDAPESVGGGFKPTEYIHNNNQGSSTDNQDPSTLKTEQFGGKGRNKPPIDLKPRIVRVSDNSTASINKDEFIIGRNRDEVDYVAGNSTYIGRKHCKIIRKDEEFFIVDISSNGTLLNGGELEKGAAEHLSHDDRITIINEEFIFKLY